MSLMDSISNILNRTEETKQALDELEKMTITSSEKKEKEKKVLSWDEKVAVLKTEVNSVLSKYKDGEQLSLDDKDKFFILSDKAVALGDENPKKNDLGDYGYNLNEMILKGVKKEKKDVELSNDFEM